MNWDMIAGNWKQFMGQFKEKWGKLTDNDWQQINGKRDQLVGKLQERYGYTRQQAEQEADRFASALRTTGQATEDTVRDVNRRTGG